MAPGTASHELKILPFGDSALLVELDSMQDVLALHAALRDNPPDGVIDLVPAARTVLVMFDPRRTTARRLADEVAKRPRTTTVRAQHRLIEIPVSYDGEDLGEVAAKTGLSPEEIVERHTRPTYTVAFNGFAPGFAYLTGLDPALRVPRRETPRTRVPAGALAIADQFSGIYPRQAPGGWNIIGRTDVVLWNPTRTPPALLLPGARVRFLDVRKVTTGDIRPAARTAAR